VDKELYVYYELEDFYQNHRRYVKSRSDDQLRDADGVEAGSTLQTACDPTASYNVQGKDGTTVDNYWYWACGLIATSVFNDGIFYNPCPSGNCDNTKAWSESDIAWSSDLSEKFKNPSTIDYSTWQYNWQTYSQMGCYEKVSYENNLAKPLAWVRGPCHTWNSSSSAAAPLKPNVKFVDNCESCNADHVLVSEGGIHGPDSDGVCPDAHPNCGIKNEHFVVWMRTAGLPTFRKLYATIPAQKWEVGDKIQIIVVPNFVVSTFNGKKSIVISTTSWLGGKNSVLGISYIVVGSICWLLALIFAIKQWLNPRKLGDTKYLVWKNRS